MGVHNLRWKRGVEAGRHGFQYAMDPTHRCHVVESFERKCEDVVLLSQLELPVMDRKRLQQTRSIRGREEHSTFICMTMAQSILKELPSGVMTFATPLAE